MPNQNLQPTNDSLAYTRSNSFFGRLLLSNIVFLRLLCKGSSKLQYIHENLTLSSLFVCCTVFQWKTQSARHTQKNLSATNRWNCFLFVKQHWRTQCMASRMKALNDVQQCHNSKSSILYNSFGEAMSDCCSAPVHSFSRNFYIPKHLILFFVSRNLRSGIDIFESIIIIIVQTWM